MFAALAQTATDSLPAVAQFGVAGLMGGLWWWERKYSRQREDQLTEAHNQILSQREHLQSFLEALQNNTKAITEFTAAHQELLRTLGDRHP